MRDEFGWDKFPKFCVSLLLKGVGDLVSKNSELTDKNIIRIKGFYLKSENSDRLKQNNKKLQTIRPEFLDFF